MLNVCHAMGRAIIIYIVYTHCTKCNAQRKRNALFSLTAIIGSKNGVLVISVCGQWQYEKKTGMHIPCTLASEVQDE